MANEEKPIYPAIDNGTPFGWELLKSLIKAVEQKDKDWIKTYHALELAKAFQDIEKGVEPKKALDLIRRKKKPTSPETIINDIKNAMGVVKYHREGKKIPDAMEAVWRDKNYPAKSFKKVKTSYENYRKIAIYHIENNLPAEKAYILSGDFYITPIFK